MINLAVDIGNTYAKVGFFEDSQMTEVHTGLNKKALAKLLKSTFFETAILSSVAPLPDGLTSIFSPDHQIMYVDVNTKLPFTNLYSTPQTLGTDRIAVVAGAAFLYPNRNVLAIDMGTCVTYDLIDRQKRYHGGAISPGMQMRLKAMHTFTARLPLVSTENISAKEISLIGKSTQEAMLSGAVHGMGSEITQMIRMYADKFADLQVVICGGDASYLTEIIQPNHTIISELTLIGLNRILIHNVS